LIKIFNPPSCYKLYSARILVFIIGEESMFKEDGIEIIENFLPEETLKNLNRELDLTFSKYSINGDLSCTHKFGGWEKNLSECTVPGLLCSVNIFEIVVDVAKQFRKHFERFVTEDYVITYMTIFSEKENPNPLPWHTDNRHGMVRAMIYLKGGEDNSGQFLYMKGSHNRDYHIEHKLSSEKILQLEHSVIEAAAPIGSLLMFDSVGFHAKKKCPNERRVIFLEFQPRSHQFSKERILLSSNHLTEKVISNINLFANTDFTSEDIGCHGHESYIQNSTPLPFKVSMQELKKSAIHIAQRMLRKTWKNTPIFKNYIPFKLR
jgi:hypothetical protein